MNTLMWCQLIMQIIVYNNLPHLGTKVVDVIATDADDPTTANADLIYSLVQGTSAFEIKNTTGKLPAMASIKLIRMSRLFFTWAWIRADHKDNTFPFSLQVRSGAR